VARAGSREIGLGEVAPRVDGDADEALAAQLVEELVVIADELPDDRGDDAEAGALRQGEGGLDHVSRRCGGHALAG
jgi:hypothetical protein